MDAATSLAFLGTSFGPWEILLIVAIILLLFGASRIPELARSLGKGVNEFKKGIKGEEPPAGLPKPPDGSDPKALEGPRKP
jgi:sec-independent protein translocase protein TatA